MKKNIIWIVLAVIVIGGPLAYWGYYMSTPGKYDALAQCIADKGAKFYGAFWCPHCQAQKAMFGKSAKLLPYIECSNPSGNGQLQLCVDAKITNYPTWEFPDGERQVGEIKPADLAAKLNCTI
jgi:hypothetical protein